MPKTTLKSSPAVTTVNKAFSSKTPKRYKLGHYNLQAHKTTTVACIIMIYTYL